jgi:uncharacterized protein involved in exopolysaccharide biosynthesis
MEAVPVRTTEAPPPGEGLDLRPVLRAMWRERVRVIAVVAVAGALTLGVSFLLPKWYRATAVMLPPEESDLISNMALAQRALTKFPAFGILGDYFTPADIFKAVLLSRTVQEDIVSEFDLQRLYKQKSHEKTLKALKGHYKVKLNPDGTIAVSVEDQDPRRAAAMANAMLTALDRYNVEKRGTQAQRTRMFLERRVAETDSLLRLSEIALKQYQEVHHTVAPPGAGGGDVSAAADLMARKIMLEVRLGVLRGYLREDNDLVVQTRNELEQLKQSIGSLPALQDELLRLLRDQKIEEQLYLLLTAELEQARIRETMDTPTVQVLDPAVPPERHSRPRRLTLAVAAGMIALLGCTVWIAYREGRSADRPA